MEKRDVKEMAATREKLYGAALADMDFAAIGYEVMGMSKDGLLVKESETGLFALVKVVAKGLNFNADEALDAYADARAKEAERKAKHDEKVAKEAAKRAKAKADKEAEKDGKMAEGEVE